MEWVEIFKSGKWRDSAGVESSWTNDDLDGVVSAFEELKGQVRVPIRLGGHAEVAPAVGWIEGLKRSGDTLMAYCDIVSGVAREAIAKRMYRSVSAGFVTNWKRGEKTYKAALNHLAILGGRLPAVTGLAELPALFGYADFEREATGSTFTTIVNEGDDMDEKQFQEAQAKVVELTAKLADADARDAASRTEIETLKGSLATANEAIAKFQAHEAKVEVETLVDTAIRAGRAIPKTRDNLIKAGIALRSQANFAATDSGFAAWKESLEKGPKILDYAEKAEGGEEDPDDGVTTKEQREFEAERAAGREAGKKIAGA